MDPSMYPDAALEILEENERKIEQLNKIPSDDYYATLNVARKATHDQIKESYRKLCMIYHPDKHVTPQVKEAAESRFHHINHAYEVLIDPAKRALYDAYGPDCPELTVHTQLGPVLKSPDELRVEYEERIRRENLHKLEQLIRQRDSITIALDATPSLFANPLNEEESASRKLPNLQFFQLKYSTESPIANGLSIALMGKAFSQGSQGSGTVRAITRMTISPQARAEMGVNLISPHNANFKVIQTLGKSGRTSMSADFQFSQVSQPPIVSLELTRHLVKNQPFVGFVKVHSGHHKLANLVWQRAYSASQIQRALGSEGQTVVNVDAIPQVVGGIQWGRINTSTLVLSCSLLQNVLQVMHQRRFGADTTLNISTVLNLDEGGLGGNWKMTHRVAEYTKCGMGVSFGASGRNMGDTTFNLEFEHYHQKIQIPIMLLPQPNMVIAALATAIPLIASAGSYVGIIRPHRTRAIAAKLAELKAKHVDILEMRKKEALEAVLVLQRVIDRKWKEEVACSGLVIMQALYGKVQQVVKQQSKGVLKANKIVTPIQLQPDEATGIIDVTLSVMAMVEQSMLRIEGEQHKYSLLGFYDPCFGEDKQLLITYCFRGIYRQVLVEDTMGVNCPQRSHVELQPAQVMISETIKQVRDRVKTLKTEN